MKKNEKGLCPPHFTGPGETTACPGATWSYEKMGPQLAPSLSQQSFIRKSARS